MDWKTITLYTRSPFRLSYGVTGHRRVYWLRLTDECGWGEAAIPPYYGVRDEDMIDLWREKARQSRPLPEDIEEIPSWVGTEGPAPARCALDMALHDYLASTLGIPLYELLGLTRPGPAVTSLTIPMASPDEMASMAAKADAFPSLKLKIGSDDDIARVAAVRKARPDASLLVDANAGWSAIAAVQQIRRLEPFGLDMVEQPVARDDFEGLAHVQRNVGVPVIADESVRSIEHLQKLAELGIRAVNLKLMKVGGISVCHRMIRTARDLGVRIMLGCMIETSLGVTAMAHLSGLADWIDLDSPLLIKNDPFVGVRYADARLELPRGPGIGVVRRYPQKAAEQIEALKRDRFFDERTTVFDVHLTALENGEVKLRGQVLEAHQKESLLASLDPMDPVGEDIAVLLGPETSGALVSRVISDLFRSPDCLSERLNQAVLGDEVRILAMEGDWARVQLSRDGYLGWIQMEALSVFPRRTCHDYLKGRGHMILPPLTDAYARPDEGALKVGMLPMGLKVRAGEVAGGFTAIELPDERLWWVRTDSLLPASAWPQADEAGIRVCLELVRQLVGVPYLWGGCTPFGYDCSGLTQVFWSLMGVDLPRDADQQYRRGRPVDVAHDGRGARPGDLLFFGKPGRTKDDGTTPEIPHVALSLGDSEFLHANGTSWSLTYNSLSPAAPTYRADLHGSLIGVRRYRKNGQ
ncbi:MAG: enolase C-terminal domain-like protein [Desulfobacterales bacterium]